MTNKERFIEIYKTYIKRSGSEKLLEYLLSPHSDFFEAPASARFHGNYDGGLLDHSLNVYDCLKDYLQRERVKSTYGMNYSEETIAIVSLLHDLCKINCYKKGTRNVKKDGQWIQVPNYEFDDQVEDARNVGKAFEMFPLAFALSTADMEATYFIEGKKDE